MSDKILELLRQLEEEVNAGRVRVGMAGDEQTTAISLTIADHNQGIGFDIDKSTGQLEQYAYTLGAK